MFRHKEILDDTKMYPLDEALGLRHFSVHYFLPFGLIYFLSSIFLGFITSTHAVNELPNRPAISMKSALLETALALVFASIYIVWKERKALGQFGLRYFFAFEQGRRILFALSISWGGAMAFLYYSLFAWGLLSYLVAQAFVALALILGNLILLAFSYELSSYIFFGAMTYIVSVLSFSGADFFFTNLFSESESVSWFWAFSISFLAAVLFAYVSNRYFVFSQKGNFWIDFWKFLSARIFSSLIIEVLGMAIAIDLLQVDRDLSRAAASIAVTVANYFLSKYFVFRKKAVLDKGDFDE